MEEMHRGEPTKEGTLAMGDTRERGDDGHATDESLRKSNWITPGDYTAIYCARFNVVELGEDPGGSRSALLAD